jgi:hypothetical protein
MRSRLLPVPAVVAAVAAAGDRKTGQPMRATYGAAVRPEAEQTSCPGNKADTVALCGW